MKESDSDEVQVMVVSPIPSLRVGLKAILNSISDIKIAAEAASLDGSSALPLAIDVVVIGGLEIATGDWVNAVLRDYPEQAFLFLANSAAFVLADGLPGRNRPLGWLRLDAPPSEIAAAIRALQAGLTVLDPLYFSHTYTHGRSLPDGSTSLSSIAEEIQGLDFEPLTRRETDVLELLAQGLANKEIARRLIISEHTVKYHISSIYSKFGVNNRTEAVRQGIRAGLVVI